MNQSRYKIDTAYLEEVRMKEGLSIDEFRKRFVTNKGNQLAYTTYYHLLNRGICVASTMLAIEKRYPEVI